MDSNNAALYLPLVKALSKGKTLQSNIFDGKWKDLHQATFRFPPENYRIKPESKQSWLTLYKGARTGGRYDSLEKAKNLAGLGCIGYIHVILEGMDSVSLTFIPKD